MTSAISQTGFPTKKWDQAIYSFLAEKYRLSGSDRTVSSYSGILRTFFEGTSKSPDDVFSSDVFSYAYGVGPSGREPSASTINSRIACLSSLYRFLIRMDLVVSNPCDHLDRPRTNPAVPKGLSVDEVRKLLAIIPDSRAGLRDRAIVLMLFLTGRRRSEILNLSAGDLELGEPAYYRYRGKGGKRGRRELPKPVLKSIERALRAFGKELPIMEPSEPLWPSTGRDGPVSQAAFYANFQRYLNNAGLQRSGVHITRHTAAKLRRDAGAPLEEISAFLDHSSLAVTSIYLQRLEGQQDDRWEAVARDLGVV